MRARKAGATCSRAGSSSPTSAARRTCTRRTRRCARRSSTTASGSSTSPKEEVIKRIVDGFQQMAAYAKPAGVTVLIESHGDFTNSPDLKTIIEGVGSPAFALLWDAHHTFVAGGEAPAETYKQLGRYMRHTHLKDSKPEGNDHRYVLTGTGVVPVKEQVRVLATNGYKGFYCYEWEKKWHPEIEEPEVAFPHYVKVMTQYLDEAGVKA
ncbi:MAG: hypothetical protein DMF82_25315 [Acidobacteria bacterium]|nr:MAG: hypothetical protein DMF82_25315 [Acidobacteriota bacterium]